MQGQLTESPIKHLQSMFWNINNNNNNNNNKINNDNNYDNNNNNNKSDGVEKWGGEKIKSETRLARCRKATMQGYTSIVSSSPMSCFASLA